MSLIYGSSFMHKDYVPNVKGRVSAQDIQKEADTLDLECLWGEIIEPGDLYMAGRNTGVKLLTCKSVSDENWVNPVELAYPYDNYECVKVREKH